MQQGMTIQSIGKQQRLEEWKERVAACRQSGDTVTFKSIHCHRKSTGVFPVLQF